MYRTDFWTLWEKARVGWSERTASKHVYYQGWNRSPVQVGCMRQVLGAGALGWPRGVGWGGRWEGGSGWGTHVNPWLIHVNVWQKPLQYCKVISLQLIKIIGKKKVRINSIFIVNSKDRTNVIFKYQNSFQFALIMLAFFKKNTKLTYCQIFQCHFIFTVSYFPPVSMGWSTLVSWIRFLLFGGRLSK